MKGVIEMGVFKQNNKVNKNYTQGSVKIKYGNARNVNFHIIRNIKVLIAENMKKDSNKKSKNKLEKNNKWIC